MKAFTLDRILFVCLNEKDIKVILTGALLVETLKNEHQVSVHMFPEDVITSHIDWMDQKRNPEIDFFSETKKFDLSISTYDLKHPNFSVIHVEQYFIPENSLIRGLKIFMHDLMTNDGYPTTQRVKGYLTCNLRRLEAAT